MARRYDLLALDLDGTLLTPDGHVHPENAAAIARARAEGLTVTICTGRALIETRRVIDAVQQRDPVIVCGGAMVADPLSGQTLERFTMDRGLVERVTAFLHERGFAALLLKDPYPTGFDYLVVSKNGLEDIDPATRWWLDHQGIGARAVNRLDDDPHPEHTVRIGAYSTNKPILDFAQELKSTFHAEVMLQHFTGALMPARRLQLGIESVHIVELFNPQADKWQALSRLASRLGVPRERVCAVGDENNDLSMITHAGLGIAMGNASSAVKAAAKRHTDSNANAGVARAIEKVLSGEW